MAKVFEPLDAAFPGVYHNPVFPGDFPDPSVIRVGDAFYAVTTSTDWAPFFPIFRSFDLVRWSIVGHVFAERPVWCVGNFWAPDLAERDGRFFVYYTARRADGPLCVAVATADHPEGPYADHGPLVGQRCGSIDAMATDDEFGDRWLLWKEDGNSVGDPTPIWAQALDPPARRCAASRSSSSATTSRGKRTSSRRRTSSAMTAGSTCSTPATRAAAKTARTPSASRDRCCSPGRGRSTRTTRSSPETTRSSARATAPPSAMRRGAGSTCITRTSTRATGSSSGASSASTRSSGATTAGRRSIAGEGRAGMRRHRSERCAFRRGARARVRT